MKTSLSARSVRAIRTALLRFFDDVGRDLPWRRSSDPYAIWISEVMLQQTRVETVVLYYDRWLGRFPDVDSLAAAPLDDVLKAWEGLGYYSRARNLHSAAAVIRERHAGSLPASWDDLRALPGVGDYTAGAVSSIAFNQPYPAIDGNVRRVIARLLDDPAPTPSTVRDVVTALVPRDRPGDFNQALMELGATICTPRAPRCPRCPIARHCAARAAGTQLLRPQRIAKKNVPVVVMATAVLRRRDGRFLIVRRPDTGLLAGLWNFPGVEVPAGASVVETVTRIAALYSRNVAMPRALCSITHVFSHRHEQYNCWIIDAGDSWSEHADTAWIDTPDERYALPRAQQKILAHALAAGD